MNEPKRRGRPPRIVTDAVADGGLSSAPATHDEFARREAQSYANRVWKGQSINLHRNERLRRVKAALEAQGMSMEGVDL